MPALHNSALGLAVVLVAAGAGAAPAHAADLWVDNGAPGCSDARTAAQAASSSTPFCTISRAAALAQAGDTVRIEPGVYRETVRPARSGTASAPIQYVGASAGVVVDAAGGANAIKLMDVSNVSLSGIEVRGGVGEGIWMQGGTGIVLSDLVVRANPGAGVEIRGSAGLVVSDSTLTGNGGAGIMELAGTSGGRYTGDTITANGAAGSTYNGDGIQLGGTGALIDDDEIIGNGGTSMFQHGVYAGKTSSGWTISHSTLAANAGANVKASGGPGTIAYDHIVGGTWGVVLSDNPVPVTVEANVISGAAQHLVFLTSDTTPARARIWSNTIVQSGRSTASGDASAVFVNAATSLDLRDDVVCYDNADSLGVALWVNDASRLGSLTSDANWFSGDDARDRDFAWNGSRVTLSGWRPASGEDASSIDSAPPAFDDELHVASTDLGAGAGVNLGVGVDVAGTPFPASGPVDIGAYAG